MKSSDCVCPSTVFKEFLTSLFRCMESLPKDLQPTYNYRVINDLFVYVEEVNKEGC